MTLNLLIKYIYSPGCWGQTYFTLDLFLDEVVLAFVVEDDMDLLGAVATDIWPC